MMRSLVMTTGELDYSDTFRFGDDDGEVHYDVMTNFLWVLFIILMPVLFANLLVSKRLVIHLNIHIHIDWSCCWRYTKSRRKCHLDLPRTSGTNFCTDPIHMQVVPLMDSYKLNVISTMCCLYLYLKQCSNQVFVL